MVVDPATDTTGAPPTDLRILVVANLYPPLSYGGYEDLTAGAVAHWRAAGATVEVLTSQYRADEAPGAELGVHRVLPMRWTPEALPRVPLRQRIDDLRESFGAWTDALDRFRPDVVSLWNIPALSLGPLRLLDERHIPTVAVLSNTWMSYAARLDPFLRVFARAPRPVGQFVTRLTGLPTTTPPVQDLTALFGSEFIKREYEREHDLAARHLAVVPHGVATERFAAPDPATVDEWRGRLLYVGRLEAEKGVLAAVDAFAELRDTGTARTLTLVGGGSAVYRAMVESRIAELDLDRSVRVVGAKPASDMPSYFAAADAVLFPSEWDEPFGIVPLEAMAAGVPVVASGTGGASETMRDGVNALFFTPGAVPELARAVTRLAKDPALRATLRANGQRTATWLSRSHTYDDLLAWHRHVVDATHAVPAARPVFPPEVA